MPTAEEKQEAFEELLRRGAVKSTEQKEAAKELVRRGAIKNPRTGVAPAFLDPYGDPADQKSAPAKKPAGNPYGLPQEKVAGFEEYRRQFPQKPPAQQIGDYLGVSLHDEPARSNKAYDKARSWATSADANNQKNASSPIRQGFAGANTKLKAQKQESVLDKAKALPGKALDVAMLPARAADNIATVAALSSPLASKGAKDAFDASVKAYMKAGYTEGKATGEAMREMEAKDPNFYARIRPGAFQDLRAHKHGLAGIGAGVADLATSVATPGNAVLGGGIAKAPKMAQRAASLLFGAQMAHGGVQQMQEGVKGKDTQAFTKGLASLALGGLALGHATGAGERITNAVRKGARNTGEISPAKEKPNVQNGKPQLRQTERAAEGAGSKPFIKEDSPEEKTGRIPEAKRGGEATLRDDATQHSVPAGSRNDTQTPRSIPAEVVEQAKKYAAQHERAYNDWLRAHKEGNEERLNSASSRQQFYREKVADLVKKHGEFPDDTVNYVAEIHKDIQTAEEANKKNRNKGIPAADKQEIAQEFNKKPAAPIEQESSESETKGANVPPKEPFPQAEREAMDAEYRVLRKKLLTPEGKVKPSAKPEDLARYREIQKNVQTWRNYHREYQDYAVREKLNSMGLKEGDSVRLDNGTSGPFPLEVRNGKPNIGQVPVEGDIEDWKQRISKEEQSNGTQKTGASKPVRPSPGAETGTNTGQGDTRIGNEQTGSANDNAPDTDKSERTVQEKDEDAPGAKAVQSNAETVSKVETKGANAHAAAERAGLNLEALPETERQPVNKAFEDAHKEGTAATAHELAKDVIANPRGLSETETAGVVQRMQGVKEQVNEARKALDANPSDAQAQAAHDDLLREYDTLDQARQIAGREWARTGLARQIVIDEDDYAGAIRRAKYANPEKPITPQESGQIAALTTRLAEQDKRIAELEKNRVATRQNARAKAVDSTQEGWGARNVNTKIADAQAAREGLVRTFSKAGSLPDFAEALPHLVTLAKFHFEAGARAFLDWKAAMQKETDGKLDEGELETVWASMRHERQGESKSFAQNAPQSFTDRLAQRLGREGTVGFLHDIDGDGSPEILNKLLKGEPLSSEQEKTVADAWKANAPVRNGRTNAASPPMQEITRILKENQTRTPRANAGPKVSPLDRYKDRLRKDTADFQDRIDRGDKSDYRKPVNRLPLDKEAEDLREGRARTKRELDNLINGRRKVTPLDYLVRWQRFGVLSGVSTLGKLAAAATTRMVTTPLEEMVGLIPSKALSSVAEKAPREGSPMLRAEVAALTNTFSRATLSDMWSKLRTGENSLDIMYGRAQNAHHPFLDFFSSLHGALKTPAMRNEFFRSFEKRAAYAAKQGLDLHDPAVQMQIGGAAYADSHTAILLQDNFAVSIYQDMLRAANQPKYGLAGKVTATTMRTLLPVVKVPTNFVGEAGLYLGGSLRGLAEIVRAKGLKNLTPEQSDIVLRSFKKQGVGAGLLALGYLQPDGLKASGYYQAGKKPDGGGQYSEITLFGVRIPHTFLHSPALEMIHIGATIRRATQQAQGDPMQGLSSSSYQAGKGLIEQVPFVQEQIKMGQAAQTESGTGKALGEEARSIAIPMLIQQIAGYGDKEERRPRGFTDALKLGVPGLRGQVPPKSSGSGGEIGKTLREAMKGAK